MKLQLIRHLWGVTGNPETTFPKFRELGFTGIEGALPAPQERRKFSRLLKQHRETGNGVRVQLLDKNTDTRCDKSSLAA